MKNIICIKCLNKDTIKSDELKVKCSKCSCDINVIESEFLYDVDELYLKTLTEKTKDYKYSDMFVLTYELAVLYDEEKYFDNKYKYLYFSASSGYQEAITQLESLVCIIENKIKDTNKLIKIYRELAELFNMTKNQDSNKVFNYYYKGSLLNDDVCLCEVGKCYSSGDGVKEKDNTIALDYFTKAIDLGNADAALNAAKVLENIGEKDECIKYLTKAGEMGLLRAQKILAYYYEDTHRYFSYDSFFIRKNELFSREKPYHDFELAQYWHNKAKEQGDVESKEALVKYTYAKEYVISEDSFVLSCAKYVDSSHCEFMRNINSKILVLGGSITKSFSIGSLKKMEVLIYTGSNGLRKTPGYKRTTDYTMIYTSGNFLKGNFELVEGCIYIFNNWERFPDKQTMLKNLKSKSDKIRNVLIEIAHSPKRGRSIEILIENKIVPYDILVEYAKLPLTSSERILVLDTMESSSEKEKNNYKKREERITDLELGIEEYSLKDFKKVFNCTIEDGVIVLNKCITTDDKIIFPASIDGISKYLFKSQQKNTNVKKMYFEEGVKVITATDLAFNKYPSLEEIYLPRTLEYIDITIIDNLPENVNVISSNNNNQANVMMIDNLLIQSNSIIYVNNKDTLQKVTIPDFITSLPDDIFSFCTSLVEVNLHNNLTSIPTNAFNNCRSLKSIVLPNKISKIGSDAFYNCESLVDISLPETLTDIGSGVFQHCASLTKFYLPKNILSIPDETFFDCTSLEKIEIKGEITSIGKSSFCRCSKLLEIVIPKSVNKIGDSAFCCCESLKHIILPDSIKKIESHLFGGCINLESVTLPNKIRSLGKCRRTSNTRYICSISEMSKLETIRINGQVDLSTVSEVLNQCSSVKYLILDKSEVFKSELCATQVLNHIVENPTLYDVSEFKARLMNLSDQIQEWMKSNNPKIISYLLDNDIYKK